MLKFPSIADKEDFEEHFQSAIWLEAAVQICRRHHLSFTHLKRQENGEHIVFLVDESLVIKIYKPFRGCFDREKKALEFVADKINFEIPAIVQTGEIENYKYILMTQLSGTRMTRAVWMTLPKKEQLEFVSELANCLKQIHSLDAQSFKCDWHEFVKGRVETFIERQIAHGVNSSIIDSLPEFIDINLKLVPTNLPTVFLHGDIHFGNLRLQKYADKWKIAGLFDFADSRRGVHEYDFLAVGILMIQGQGDIQREFFKSYGYTEHQLDESFRKQMMMLTMLYETSNLRRYAERLKPEAVNFGLEELEKAIWSF